ncbi:DTX3L ligase, partial [Calyptomena viridis]|nr:DTX3L ligase [Calyptomena viridis]
RAAGGTMAAAAVGPLLVRLRPVPSASEKAIFKLQVYFQSGKRSGGGECDVRPDREPGTYWVVFREERDKKSVESRTDHFLEMGAKRLKIIIQRGEGDPSNSQVTTQASASCDAPASPSLPKQEHQAASDHGYMAREVLTEKIFLTVSATLNTSMFTEEQREKIAILCPNLKREGNPDIDGSEKLTGDFTDIEKAYHYFEDILARNDPTHNFSHSESEAQEGENSQAEKNMKISSEQYKYRNGIAVDASVFKLLETILNKEIEHIADKFDTVLEKKEILYEQKVFIIFRPKIKTFDMSSHATESFINAFQSASAMLREKLINLKLSEEQNKTLNMLVKGKQLEDLHVKLKKDEDKLILSGLPDHLYAAEKQIMNLLTTEDSIYTKTKALMSSDLSSQEPTEAPKKKYSVRQKNNLASRGQAKAKTKEKDDDDCPICMERITNKKILTKCKHAFCKVCIDKAMSYKQACPLCNTIYGVMKGDQPEGTMSSEKWYFSLPGYANCGTIVIEYSMKGGIQTSNHPNPGQPYGSTCRTAYLPDNEEGQEILKLLKRAFSQKLIFTVGQSRTTGAKNVITWNDIHHKTSVNGGPANFGYPDPDYLQRVRAELKAKGIE